jgi:hypothetical protein
MVEDTRPGYSFTLAQFQTLYQGDSFAATAYTKAYLPCAVILSAQIDGDILLRYRAEKWTVPTGIEGAKNPHISTYVSGPG